VGYLPALKIDAGGELKEEGSYQFSTLTTGPGLNARRMRPTSVTHHPSDDSAIHSIRPAGDARRSSVKAKPDIGARAQGDRRSVGQRAMGKGAMRLLNSIPSLNSTWKLNRREPESA
jgi:hypothetical protein